jgi:pimeloyl-ACP methyl ester carboxylesterase
MRLLAALGLIVVLLSVPNAVVAQSTPEVASPIAASGDFAGLVDIGGGRRMYLECRGEGGPTVVLEAGYGNAGAIWDQAALEADSDKTAVLPGVASFTRVCAYDRPGAPSPPSRSDPVPQPRTITAVVADLHALLEAAGEPGPYVLVGHSLGGLMVRLYAATYPEEVAGLVLVDPAAEGWEAQVRAMLTPEQADALAALQNAAAEGDPAIERYGPDGIGIDEAGEEVRAAVAARPFAGTPMVLITHGVPMGSDLPPGLLPPTFPWEALDRVSAELHRELVAVTPGAQLVVAAESGHYVQLDQPELVIDAVRQVVEAVRDPADWATPAASSSPVA